MKASTVPFIPFLLNPDITVKELASGFIRLSNHIRFAESITRSEFITFIRHLATVYGNSKFRDLPFDQCRVQDNALNGGLASIIMQTRFKHEMLNMSLGNVTGRRTRLEANTVGTGFHGYVLLHRKLLYMTQPGATGFVLKRSHGKQSYIFHGVDSSHGYRRALPVQMHPRSVHPETETTIKQLIDNISYTMIRNARYGSISIVLSEIDRFHKIMDSRANSRIILL